MLRVSRECEIVGLDAYKHDDEAYPECKLGIYNIATACILFLLSGCLCFS